MLCMSLDCDRNWWTFVMQISSFHFGLDRWKVGSPCDFPIWFSLYHQRKLVLSATTSAQPPGPLLWLWKTRSPLQTFSAKFRWTLFRSPRSRPLLFFRPQKLTWNRVYRTCFWFFFGGVSWHRDNDVFLEHVNEETLPKEIPLTAAQYAYGPWNCI